MLFLKIFSSPPRFFGGAEFLLWAGLLWALLCGVSLGLLSGSGLRAAPWACLCHLSAAETKTVRQPLCQYLHEAEQMGLKTWHDFIDLLSLREFLSQGFIFHLPRALLGYCLHSSPSRKMGQNFQLLLAGLIHLSQINNLMCLPTEQMLELIT